MHPKIITAHVPLENETDRMSYPVVSLLQLC